ncbi:MAG TPA: sugar kinase, partial [Bacteroidales bacterium]|nr:sugar kinase [Bacteroidales bacterium]
MITTFGEIMLRIQPAESGERIRQAALFRITPGGSESNVAIALSNLGLHTTFVTALPNNELAQSIMEHLWQFGVDTQYIIQEGERLGLYFTETGIGPRNSFVVYDRAESAFSRATPEMFPLHEMMHKSSWFHFSGISPAVSESVTEILMQATAEPPCPYSVDLNYREKLWQWVEHDKDAIRNVMTELCENATMIAGNETDFQNIFGLKSAASNKADAFADIAQQCFNLFPKTKFITISDRTAISATTNHWGGFLFVRDNPVFGFCGKEYTIDHILDRVGTGDSFVAGIIYGLVDNKQQDYQQVIDFAVALSALNHTTVGDASRFSVADVLKTIESSGSG